MSIYTRMVFAFCVSPIFTSPGLSRRRRDVDLACSHREFAPCTYEPSWPALGVTSLHFTLLLVSLRRAVEGTQQLEGTLLLPQLLERTDVTHFPRALLQVPRWDPTWRKGACVWRWGFPTPPPDASLN